MFAGFNLKLRSGQGWVNSRIHMFSFETCVEIVASLQLFEYGQRARRTLMQTAEDEKLDREGILKSSTTNPALQRLQARVRAGALASEIITSYDRMHHRHNRS